LSGSSVVAIFICPVVVYAVPFALSKAPLEETFMATVSRAPNFHVLGASTFIFSATRNRKLLILFERRYHAKHERTAAAVG
jgi:hypothetical protein